MAGEVTNNISLNKPAEAKRSNFWLELLIRLVKEKPLGAIGLIIVFLFLFTGIFADLLAPYPMNKIELMAKLQPASPQHLLGTDNLGRDMLSNLIYGARVSMLIGLSATIITTLVSVILGALSAFIGGKFDMVLQRFIDAWLCIPGFLILLIIMTIMGKGTLQTILALSVPMGIGGSRMIRGAVIAIKANAYIDSGKALGASTWTLLYRHIIPNIAPVIIVGAAMQVGGIIMMESGLSFLGYGVPPGVPSWGSMLSQEGRQYMEIAPSLAFWPGFALSLVVFGTNMFGDALRDLLDPRLKGGVGSYAGPKKKIKI